MKRTDILCIASELVSITREGQYGDPNSNFAVIARLWGIYLGRELTSHDVAVLMALLKIGRVITGDKTKTDNYIDAAGYIAIAGELAE